MKAVKFNDKCLEYGGLSQFGYEQIPVMVKGDQDEMFVSCWEFSFLERLKVLLMGKVYLTVEGGQLPVNLEVDNPTVEKGDVSKELSFRLFEVDKQKGWLDFIVFEIGVQGDCYPFFNLYWEKEAEIQIKYLFFLRKGFDLDKGKSDSWLGEIAKKLTVWWKKIIKKSPPTPPLP